MFNVGDRVRHSGYALQSARDWWQSQGEPTKKERAKEAYEAKLAERGTVTALLPANPERGVSAGIEVKWDNGSVSRCLSIRIVTVF